LKAEGGIVVGDEPISSNERNEYLFHHLVAMFQTLALQQLGKLVNPITGKLERDLQQAKITIDMLQMLKDRTAGNLEQSERMILDRSLLELQMNYVDETNRADEDMSSETEEPYSPGESEKGEAETGKPVSDDGERPEDAVNEDEGAEAAASTTEKAKVRAKTEKRKSRKKKKSD
jgi:hypothetical protein